jgi:hypothetical protein
MICTAQKMSFGWYNREEEMGGVCSTYEKEDSCIQGFGKETFDNIRKLQVEATINHKFCNLYLSQLSSRQTLYW